MCECLVDEGARLNALANATYNVKIRAQGECRFDLKAIVVMMEAYLESKLAKSKHLQKAHASTVAELVALPEKLRSGTKEDETNEAPGTNLAF